MKIHIYLILSLLIFASAYPSLASEKEEWVWYEMVFGDSTRSKTITDSIERNRDYLDSLISLHQEFLKAKNIMSGQGRLDLEHVNLSKVDLSGVNLQMSTIKNSNLSDANLAGINLRGSELSGSILLNVDLTIANLKDADLSRTNLMGSSLFHVGRLKFNLPAIR